MDVSGGDDFTAEVIREAKAQLAFAGGIGSQDGDQVLHRDLIAQLWRFKGVSPLVVDGPDDFDLLILHKLELGIDDLTTSPSRHAESRRNTSGVCP